MMTTAIQVPKPFLWIMELVLVENGLVIIKHLNPI